jgi:hypothetical protein
MGQRDWAAYVAERSASSPNTGQRTVTFIRPVYYQW